MVLPPQSTRFDHLYGRRYLVHCDRKPTKHEGMSMREWWRKEEKDNRMWNTCGDLHATVPASICTLHLPRLDERSARIWRVLKLGGWWWKQPKTGNTAPQLGFPLAANWPYRPLPLPTIFQQNHEADLSAGTAGVRGALEDAVSLTLFYPLRARGWGGAWKHVWACFLALERRCRLVNLH